MRATRSRRLSGRNSYRRHAAYVRQFLHDRGIVPEGATFGDIACGTGLMMLDYAREFPQTSFVGYDLSETSVGLVNETLDAEKVGNARAYVQNIMALDQADDFDYIVSWGTVHHLPDPAQGIANICRAPQAGRDSPAGRLRPLRQRGAPDPAGDAADDRQT